MAKKILFNTPKGQCTIDLKLVAEQRADYYACEVDGNLKHSAEWDGELEYCMEDDFEGIDWLLNNTNFEDWQESGLVTKINDDVKVTDDDFWTSSDDFEIIED